MHGWIFKAELLACVISAADICARKSCDTNILRHIHSILEIKLST